MSGAYRKGVKLTDKREEEGEKAIGRGKERGRGKIRVLRGEREGKSREEKGKRKRGTDKRGERRETTGKTIDGKGRKRRGAERREWVRRGDDNGVGWLIREGRDSRGGTKGGKRRDEAEGLNGAGANQPLSTPPVHGGHALWGSRSRFLLRPSVFSILPPFGDFVHTY